MLTLSLLAYSGHNLTMRGVDVLAGLSTAQNSDWPRVVALNEPVSLMNQAGWHHESLWLKRGFFIYRDA